MGKSYQERNRESIERYGLSLYERRVAKGEELGVSRSQARGHARVEKGEVPLSVINPKPVRYERPPITKRVERFSTPSNPMKVDRVVRGRNLNIIERHFTSARPEQRVYFQVFSYEKGEQFIYKGNRGKPHGITVRELIDRVETRQRGASYDGEELSFQDALREQIAQDSAGYGGNDSPGDNDIPEDFIQAEMYVLNSGNFSW